MNDEGFKVESRMKLSFNKISVDEVIAVYIDINNNEIDMLENVYSRVFIDRRYLELIFDDNNDIKLITDNTALIGDISGNGKISFRFNIKLSKIPKLNQLPISIITYYSIKKDNYYFQGQSVSNKEFLYVYYADLKGEDGYNFLITANKSLYKKNEEVIYTINVLNSGNLSANEVIITNFIPENTKLKYESINVIGTREIYIDTDNIVINELKSDSTIKIVFSVELELGKVYEYIENKANLEYKYYLNTSPFPRELKINSNLCKVKVTRGNIFSIYDNFKHIIDKEYIYMDEIVTSTIILKNRTKYNIDNLYIKCFNLEYMNFIKGSLFISGEIVDIEDLSEGIFIGEIGSDEEVSLEYKTKLVKVPSGNCINVYSKVIYDLNNGENIENGLIDTSNVQGVGVRYVDFNENNFEKSIDKEIVSIGEEVNITLKIENKGNIKANNLFVCDKLLDCLEFVKGSLKVNSQILKYEDISNGIYLGDLESNYICVVEYKAVVIKMNKNHFKSYSTIDYGYINSEGIEVKKRNSSNNLSLVIRGVNLESLKKSADKNTCKLGDIISFNIQVENKGSCEAYGLRFSEKPNSYFEVINGSTFVNDVLCEEEDIYAGIWVDMLMPYESVNIKYKLKVINLPNDYVVSENCKLEYMYNDINNYNVINQVIQSNSTNLILKDTVISCYDVSFEKNNFNNARYIVDNQEIFFNMIIKNNGNYSATEVNFREIIGDEFELISGSLYVNNMKARDEDLIKGIIITELQPKREINIKFKLIPVGNDLNIKNVISKISYIDMVDNRKKTIEYIEAIEFIKPKINITKIIDKKIVYVRDEIIESIIIKNVGNVNINKIKVSKNKYEFLDYIDNSLEVNRRYYEDSDYIIIEDLDVNNSINISLMYRVNSLYQGMYKLEETMVYASIKSIEKSLDYSLQEKSNEEELNIINNSILIDEKISNNSMILNQCTEYSIIISNSGNAICDEAILDINFNNNIKIEKLIIDGKCRYDINSPKKIYIGRLRPLDIIEVKAFLIPIEIVENNEEYLYSTLSAVFTYKDDIFYDRREKFNSSGIKVKIEELSVSLISKCSNDIVNYGEEIEVENTIYNNGTINIRNIILEQESMSKFLFKSSYWDINNCEIKSNGNAILINDIPANEKVIIRQKYIYEGEEGGGVMESKARAMYAYINPSTCKEESDVIEGNMVKIEKTIATFKEININGDICLEDTEPNIYEVAGVETEYIIIDNYYISTIESVSYDNQILTGKKVVVNGVIRERIEYVADNELKTVYVLFREYPLSTFMIIPKGKSEVRMNFNVEIESVYFNAINKRKIFRDINLVLEGY